jgi:membrane-associated PAP2 superfamily phosphatase
MGIIESAKWRIWWEHLRIPLLCFVLLAGALVVTSGDVAIANALFFDAGRQRWIGADTWWSNDLLHTGGRWAMRGIVLAALAICAIASRFPHWRSLRRPAAYFASSIILSVAFVGLLKVLTNVDCPWDLAPFGGDQPFVQLFADRPDALPPAHCFPAAHASSGYALLASYFALRERRARLARCGLAIGLFTVLAFGVAQQARGAHFVSHDVWSAFIVWFVALTLYVFAFDARLWDTPLPQLEDQIEHAEYDQQADHENDTHYPTEDLEHR